MRRCILLVSWFTMYAIEEVIQVASSVLKSSLAKYGVGGRVELLGYNPSMTEAHREQ